MSIPNSGTVLNTGDVQKVLFKRPSLSIFVLKNGLFG